MNKSYIIILALACIGLYACNLSQKEPINFGEEQCYFCKMTIVNQQYGSELITEKGRVYKYDDLQCMVNDIDQRDINYSAIYFISFDKPGKLFPLDEVQFVQSTELRTPMNSEIAAFVKRKNIDSTYSQVDWHQIKPKSVYER